MGVNNTWSRRMGAGRAQVSDTRNLRDMEHGGAPLAGNRIRHWKRPSFGFGAHGEGVSVARAAGLAPKVEDMVKPLLASAKDAASPSRKLAVDGGEQCAALKAGKPSRARFHPGSPVMRNQWRGPLRP